MRLGRRHPEGRAEPAVSPVVAVSGVELARAVDRGMAAAPRLLASFHEGGLAEDERREALALARDLGAEVRITYTLAPAAHQQLQEELLPFPAMRVALRLSYALLALAGAEPEELALLSSAEVTRLLAEEGAEEWMDTMRRIGAGSGDGPG